MGEIDGNLNPDEKNNLSDATQLGRSRSTMSATALTEYSGAAWLAFNLLEGRVAALDLGPVGFLIARIEGSLGYRLSEAGSLGRSPRNINKTDLTEFAGALYSGYESLASRVGILESAPAGTELEDRLESTDKAELLEAAPAGRSKSIMNAIQLTEWAGATNAAYNALEARVSALENAT